jgi:geranylgeranyl diphosphate synthase type II
VSLKVDNPAPPAVSSEWSRWFEQQREAVDEAISAHLGELKSDSRPHSRLLAAVEYSLGEGGKRLRPILVLESCRVAGGHSALAWPAAISVECVHAFSLIHDDLPAMDDDDLRRGRPTNHKVFGEAMAILAGDWLLAHAFALLSADGIDRQLAADWVRILSDGTLAMVVGQGADIAGEGHPANTELVEFIHVHKTASLLEASCRLGARAAGAPAEAFGALGRYGQRLGLGFQVVDDLLDHTGSADQLGKRVGKDAEASKQTYPAALGVEGSRARARELVAEAVAALEPFGERAERLRGLAQFVLTRDR